MIPDADGGTSMVDGAVVATTITSRFDPLTAGNWLDDDPAKDPVTSSTIRGHIRPLKPTDGTGP
jgi:hypothetical protein